MIRLYQAAYYLPSLVGGSIAIAVMWRRIFNSDGSEADMCGNGVRCVAKYLYENKITEKTMITLDTLAGIIRPELIMENGKATLVKVDMGEPRLTRGSMSLDGDAGEKVINMPLYIEGKTYLITCVSMGNPHCVIFTDDADKAPLAAAGPLIETHQMFPYKTNVEFLEVIDDSTVKMRVWERGAGITAACGTGACAALVACVLNRYTKREAVLKLDGGDLMIKWHDNNHVFMTGPAEEVFRGTYFINPKE
jgi:diaminopimelate epimerase